MSYQGEREVARMSRQSPSWGGWETKVGDRNQRERDRDSERRGTET